MLFSHSSHMRRHIQCNRLPDVDYSAWQDKKPLWPAPQRPKADIRLLKSGTAATSTLDNVVWKPIRLPGGGVPDIFDVPVFNGTMEDMTLFEEQLSDIPQPQLFPNGTEPEIVVQERIGGFF